MTPDMDSTYSFIHRVQTVSEPYPASHSRSRENFFPEMTRLDCESHYILISGIEVKNAPVCNPLLYTSSWYTTCSSYPKEPAVFLTKLLLKVSKICRKNLTLFHTGQDQTRVYMELNRSLRVSWEIGHLTECVVSMGLTYNPDLINVCTFILKYFNSLCYK